MDKISSWCKFIALLSVLSSIMLMLLPEGKSKKTFKLLLSFIMIYSLVSPLLSVEMDFSELSSCFDFNENISVSDNLNDYEYYPMIVAAESETEEYFNGVITDMGAQGYCKAVCDIKENKVMLKEIMIYGALDREQKKTVAEEIIRIYGDESSIVFQENSNGK